MKVIYHHSTKVKQSVLTQKQEKLKVIGLLCKLDICLKKTNVKLMQHM